MNVYSYVDHSIDSCSYICVLRRANVVANFIDNVNGRDNLREAVLAEMNESEPAIFDIDSRSNEYDEDNVLTRSTFNVEFTYTTTMSGQGMWNVIVVMDSDNMPLSIVYQNDYIESEYILKISFTYILTYTQTDDIAHIDISSYFEVHNERQLRWHNIPTFLGSLTPTLLTIEDTESEFEGTIDYVSNYTLNPNLDLTSGKYYFLSMANAGPVVIVVGDDSYVTSLTPTGQDNIHFEFPSDTVPYCMNIVEDGKGLIASTDNGVYVWIREAWDSYCDPIFVGSDNFDILIPSFIDICSCYIRIPNLDRHAPLSYEIKHWTELLSEGYYDYREDVDGPNTMEEIFNPTVANTYIERFSRINDSNFDKYSSYYGTDMANRVVPTVIMNTMVSNIRYSSIDGITNPEYDFMQLIYLNLRQAALTYIDCFNKGKYELTCIVPSDMGLDVILSDSRYLISYTGGRYVLPTNAKLSNLSYCTNNSNGTHTANTMYSSAYATSTESHNGTILAYKYGIPLVRT